MALDLNYFKKALEDEKAKIEGELAGIAERNPEAPADWNVTYPEMNVEHSDKNEAADEEEELENRVGMEMGLESRLRDINTALERIQHGKYGICEVGGEKIEEARLRANPAAATCIKHSQ